MRFSNPFCKLGAKFVLLPLALLLLSGCTAMQSNASGSAVEHEIVLTAGQPKMRLTNVTLLYGESRPIELPVLGFGGAGQALRVPIPETASLTWTDMKGLRHERVVPIRAKVPQRMTSKLLTFEIYDDRLKVFVDMRQPNFQVTRDMIFDQ